jgi:cyclopropane fatty-acyl-phospholipid synthase-like methyltransferase
VALNPLGQYADDRNLRARQRLWQHQSPFFDIAGWVLNLAGLTPGLRVLDAGCGNGEYLRALAGHPVQAAGCDLSMGMLRSASQPRTRLPSSARRSTPLPASVRPGKRP